jgi:chromosome segregation ATPase
MSASIRPGRQSPKSDSTAFALMIGMVLAVAVTVGASLSSVGSGALQQALHSMGFGRDTEVQAEQRKQAASLAEMERIISRMDNEIGGLTTRITRAESNETVAGEQLARLDGELTTVTTDIKELRLRSENAAGEAWRKPVDHLNAAVTGARGDIISLRSSLDAYDQTRRGEVGALTKRLDRLEQALVTRDATASIPNAASPAARGEAGGSGVPGILGLRGSAAGEPRSGHVIDMGAAGH